MSKAMKCDRCGKLYVLNAEDEDNRDTFECEISEVIVPVISFSLMSYKGHRHEYDLCSECANELMNWLNNIPNIIELHNVEGVIGEIKVGEEE